MESAIQFYKYQAAGNDFIMIDGREQDFSQLEAKQIAQLCDRHLGVGADGIIVLDHETDQDFRMLYWNSDGSVATFCGNGGRAITAFAHFLGVAKKNDSYSFQAGDGLHSGSILTDGLVTISMKDVATYDRLGQDIFVNTGVPHLVHWLQEDEIDEMALGRKLRHDARFLPEGTNVTFIRSEGKYLHMDTYERGVEGITLACGTGVVASVLAAAIGQGLNAAGDYEREVNTGAGMHLKVSYHYDDRGFTAIRLTGQAEQVFNGTIYIRTS